MVMNFSDYRSYLKSVLADRVAKNPAYSLRALSRHVGVAPSTLSEVISGKKNLSPDKADMIGRKLDLSGREREYFNALVQYELAKSEELKISISEKLKSLSPKVKAHTISLDVFKAIADWQHMAIIELCSFPQVDTERVMKAFGMSKFEAEAAIDRLIRLDLVRRDDSGYLQKVLDDFGARSEQPNAALRAYHCQMLQKAQEAIMDQTVHERLVGSETVAFDQEQLPEVEAAMEECFTRIVEIARRSSKQNSIYHLGIQFFKLDKGV